MPHRRSLAPAILLTLPACTFITPSQPPRPITPAPATSAIGDTELKLKATDPQKGDSWGLSVEGIGDLDGDGFGDVVVGAPGWDDGASDAGAAFIYLGAATGPSSASEIPLLAASPRASDYLGDELAPVGDLDGDGHADLLVGARRYGDGDDRTGTAFLYMGASSGVATARTELLVGADSADEDKFGSAVAGGGDLNGDGFPDLVVGASKKDDGAIYAFYGDGSTYAGASQTRLTQSDSSSSPEFATSADDAGDLDGDGYAEVVVGAHDMVVDGVRTGAAYLYFGTASGLTDSRRTRITSPDEVNQGSFGVATRGAGDLDADGHADVAVSALNAGDPGAVYVFYGSTDGVDLDAVQEVSGSAVTGDTSLGLSLGAGGDVDGDGHDDLLAGDYADTSVKVGLAYLWLGGASGITLGSEHILRASDGENQDQFGSAVAIVPDVNGDGLDDLAVVASSDDDVVDHSGALYLYMGEGSPADTGSDTAEPDGDSGDPGDSGSGDGGDDGDDGGDDDTGGTTGDDGDGDGSGDDGSTDTGGRATADGDDGDAKRRGCSVGAVPDLLGLTAWALVLTVRRRRPREP